MSELAAAFGKRLRLLRTDRGWTQERLAERCGLHPTYIGLVERGERNPSLANVGRMAVGLGMTLDQLVSGIAYDARRRTWQYRLT